MSFVLDTLQRPLRDLRISVIDRCNFRCPYCMPAEKFHHAYQFLDKKNWLQFDEIERLARIFVGLGVRKLRLTGGEPLLRPGLDGLIHRLSQIPGIEDLALTTNGVMLPAWAKRLKDAGLRRLTVSLPSLDQDVFYQMSGQKATVQEVLEGIRVAQACGFLSLKINAVIQRGINDHTILDLVKYFRGSRHTLRFIEYMDVGNQNHWKYSQVVPVAEMIASINEQFPLEKIHGTEDGETAEVYRFKDGQGEVGFIASVTKAFCGTCTRLRLSADGKMYTCLFASQGVDLSASLKAGADDSILRKIMRDTWLKREDRYSDLRLSSKHHDVPKVEMFQIGG